MSEVSEIVARWAEQSAEQWALSGPPDDADDLVAGAPEDVARLGAEIDVLRAEVARGPCGGLRAEVGQLSDLLKLAGQLSYEVQRWDGAQGAVAAGAAAKAVIEAERAYTDAIMAATNRREGSDADRLEASRDRARWT